MSKIAFTIGLLVSVSLHAWFLKEPKSQRTDLDKSPQVQAVEIVEIQKKKQEKKDEILKEPEKLSPKPSEPPQPQPESNNTKQEQSQLTPQPEPKPATPPSPPPPAMAPIEVKRKQVSSDASVAGDFAGSNQGQSAPLLRIDWGSIQEALKVILASDMKLVILNKNLDIVAQLEEKSGLWVRNQVSFPPQLTYSNNFRIVDGVPAFSQFTTSQFIKPDERLAVVVPMKIETMIESEKMKSAFQKGLTFKNIYAFGGQFYVKNDHIYFKINIVQERN